MATTKERMESELKRRKLSYEELDDSDSPLAGKILSNLQELFRTDDKMERIAGSITVHLAAIGHQVSGGITDHGEAAGYLHEKAGQLLQATATRDGHLRTVLQLIEVYKAQ